MGSADSWTPTSRTGERGWRFWTIPAPGEPGSETWAAGPRVGCGSTWLTGTYDPDSILLYWPTGNPCPDYNGDERKGDNLYTIARSLALEPKTESCAGITNSRRTTLRLGPRKRRCWSTRIPGQPRKLLLHANRNGFFYVLDRHNGDCCWAKPFVKKLTWASGMARTAVPS